jgi:predicted transcriptional regulator YdeE
MAYAVKELTIRTNNSPEGMGKTFSVWQDIGSGKIPILFDSDHHVVQDKFLVAKYHQYESDETSDFDLSITSVTQDFFQKLEENVANGNYKKYEASDVDVGTCTQKVWSGVWNDQKTGNIHRAFSEDFENSIPSDFSPDGKAHCCLYIAVKQ